MSLWLTVLLAGALTFAIRLSFIGAAGRIGIPAWFERMLRFVPVAALTALIWPDLLIAQGAMSLGEPRLLAGMLALWAIQWLR